MSEAEFGSFLVALFVLLAVAHLCAYLFEKLHQPRVVGEIAAGVLLGPSLLGHFFPRLSHTIFQSPALLPEHEASGLFGLLYWLGLLLLMFASGSETRHLFSRQDQRKIGWLAGLGTGLPFLIVLTVSPLLPLDRLIGNAHERVALLLVIGIAVAVTSIPVISRIFFDLKILHTRFAQLVLGVAVIEDTVLWAVLAIATALAAGSAALSSHKIVLHITATLVFFAVGLLVAPPVFQRWSRSRWNVLAAFSPAAYLVLILFTYCALAARYEISLVFAAFLAGLATPAEGRFGEALDSLKHFSFAVFVPIYFAIVGFKLDLSKSFSLTMLGIFLAGACLIKLSCVAAGARLAGFRGLDVVNLAVATNARGGPGIVLASVAFDAGIINQAFYTTLVLLAVLTSQAAGAWLEYVLRKGWPLLAGEAVGESMPNVIPVGSAIADTRSADGPALS
jgi:Kef-type K+ transport system membrane component KefB